MSVAAKLLKSEKPVRAATRKSRVALTGIKPLVARASRHEPVAAAKAKAHFLQLLDEVDRDRQPITITKRGRIVAQLIPASDPQPVSAFDQVFGSLRGSVKITGDIISPDWEAWGPEWR